MERSQLAEEDARRRAVKGHVMHIHVQVLQTRLLAEHGKFSELMLDLGPCASWNWVDAYLRLEYGGSPALYRMLRQALMARRAIVLVDGLDEGGEA